jgi:site-specific recombinase XerD
MRPIGSTKDRLPIFEDEFNKLIELTKKDKHIQKNTKLKLLRAYTLLYLTGCRVSEIIDFTCKDIETILRHKMISLSNDTKTKKPRALLFNDVGTDMLSKLSYVDCPSSTEVLFYANNSELAMNERVFTRILNTHLSSALTPLYTTHSFRAGYITRVIEKTGNVKTASDLVGHSSIKTTIAYLSTSTKQKQDALDKVFGEQK